jgi:hypothetical protein
VSSRNLKNEAALARVGQLRQKKKTIPIFYVSDSKRAVLAVKENVSAMDRNTSVWLQH